MKGKDKHEKNVKPHEMSKNEQVPKKSQIMNENNRKQIENTMKDKNVMYWRPPWSKHE